MLLAEEDVTKNKQEQKNVSFRTVMTLDNGILKTKDQNYGTSLMGSILKENTLEHFLLVTGQKWMFGTT